MHMRLLIQLDGDFHAAAEYMKSKNFMLPLQQLSTRCQYLRRNISRKLCGFQTILIYSLKPMEAKSFDDCELQC